MWTREFREFSMFSEFRYSAHTRQKGNQVFIQERILDKKAMPPANKFKKGNTMKIQQIQAIGTHPRLMKPGRFIRNFDTVQEAAESLEGIGVSSTYQKKQAIQRVLDKKCKTSFGYYWQYV